jgi:hypothetical protein
MTTSPHQCLRELRGSLKARFATIAYFISFCEKPLSPSAPPWHRFNPVLKKQWNSPPRRAVRHRKRCPAPILLDFRFWFA